VATFTAMACPCEVRLDGGSEADAQCAVDEVRRIEAKYSRYRSDSVVARINAAAGGAWVACDPETLALLDYAAALYESSGGLFDATSGVLRRAWNFKAARLPEPELLRGLLELVGWPLVERHGSAVRLARAGMELDFGGFGKEYAADRAAALLRARGLRHGYVNLGGDLHVLGPRADGGSWDIGIQDPRRNDACIASIAVREGALATSGDYERYIEVGGQRYCHILDPRSGYPAADWRSVSVLAPLAVQAGSLATVAMLKGADAIGFLERAGVAWLAVDSHGVLHQRAAALS
jgi:thiamine biosynthesis lipoprotein